MEVQRGEKIHQIDQLIEKAERLSYQDRAARDAIERMAEMLARRLFTDGDKYVTSLNAIQYSPMVAPADEQWKREHGSSPRSLLTCSVLVGMAVLHKR